MIVPWLLYVDEEQTEYNGPGLLNLIGKENIMDELTPYADKMADVALQCASYKVTDVNSFGRAASFLTGVKALYKEIESVFAPMTDAAHKSHKAATGKRAEFLKPVEEAEAVVKEEMKAWLRNQPDFEEIKTEGVTVSKVWKHKVLDETKVPREFLVVDEKKIAALAKALGSQCKIEGIEVYAEPQIAASAAKGE